MKTRTPKAASADVAYENYTGRKRFEVEHPAHRRRIVVAAPNADSAIVAAAARWGERWQAYNFYAYCRVNEVHPAEKAEVR